MVALLVGAVVTVALLCKSICNVFCAACTYLLFQRDGEQDVRENLDHRLRLCILPLKMPAKRSGTRGTGFHRGKTNRLEDRIAPVAARSRHDGGASWRPLLVFTRVGF